MAFRFVTLTAGFSLLFGGLGWNLYHLQVQQGAYYVERAQARTEAQAALELRRGEIFFTDRSGTDIPAALNRDYPVIYASPKEIRDPEGAVERLAPILPLDQKTLTAALGNTKSAFKLLVDKASPEIVDAVAKENIVGVYVGDKQHRFYPFERLAAQLLGFVGVNADIATPTGLYGIEKLRDDELAAGGDVHLTIDRNLQAEAEQKLAELIPQYQATGGTIIVEDPKTGKILALASKPDFDPNAYADSPLGSFMNPAVQYQYEPGSVMKPFTMAAAIGSGVLTPTSTFTDVGHITLNGKTISNFNDKAYGTITMTNVIENSVNMGAVYAESKTGNQSFYEYIKRFGLGEPTGVDLPDELAGSLRNLERKSARQIDFATASFGQGVAVTPLQLINAFAALANGGLLMRPYVDAHAEPYVVRRVTDEATAGAVVGMMESAVVFNKLAAIPSFRVAGKTGTALIPDFKTGGYTDELIHTYVGFAPVSDPRLVILAKMDRPQVGELAGLTVVPAFRDLMEFALNYYNIPPDNLSIAPPAP
ncbi:MAG: penicillin-binding protein 2 [Candidatus Jorgensenbacteria bacterium]